MCVEQRLKKTETFYDRTRIINLFLTIKIHHYETRNILLYSRMYNLDMLIIPTATLTIICEHV